MAMREEHSFGGKWTDDKVDRLRRYLQAYVKVLEGKGLTTLYWDAFAGTGYRTTRKPGRKADPSHPLLPGLETDEAEELRKGSARVALEVEPSFDRYLFVERSSRRCAALEGLCRDFPHVADRIEIVTGDANEVLQDRCPKMRPKERAVVFVDPYGMQVEWRTIEAIAATRKIDLWILFPLYTGIMRMLTRDEPPPPEWAETLTRFLGTDGWRNAFYARKQTLFPEMEIDELTADFQQVGQFFIKRLETVFTRVAPSTRVFRNSTNCPLYMLCFAAGNERGADIAVRIADHILAKHQWPTTPR
jgi:three-Cys-motif partner protein